MRRIFDKLKPIFLLIGMSLAAFVIVFLTNLLIGKPKVNVKVNQSSLQVQAEEGATEEVADVDTSEPELVPISGGDENGSVFSATTTGSCSAKYQINSISVCEQDKPVIPPDPDEEEIMISPNATFYLKIITAPLELFSGMNVIDSNRLIDKENPIFKSGGEQIDETTANNLLPPNVQIDTYKPFQTDVKFGTEYVLRLAGLGEQLTDEGKR